jgi:predicted permease
MRSFRDDLRFGFRVWWNNPGFTLVAVLTLALGIAANTTVFGWIDAVLLNPFPGVRDPGELAVLETTTANRDWPIGMSFTDYRDYRDNLKLVSGVAVGRITPLSLGADGRTERAWGELVSGNYFGLLGVKPVLGRAFLPEESDDRPAAHPVAVISYKMWRSRFREDPKVLGKTIRVNRHEITIVGVAPPEFRGTMAGLSFDLWMPVTMAQAMGTGGGTLSYRGTRDLTTTLARLRPGVTVEQAASEVAALGRRLAAAYPNTNQSIEATLRPIRSARNGAQPLLVAPLRMLLGACFLMLLIVCANVANLLLARAVSRQKEFGVRMALGAGRWRLARQLLTETLLLAAAGSVVGMILAMWMGQSLLLLLPPVDAPISLDTGLTAHTLGYTVLVAVLATLISGAAPALLSVRAGLSETLKEGGRGGSGAGAHRLRGLLVTSEVALASVALIGAGLFFRSFQNASAIQPGFEMSGITVSQFYLSSSGYSAQEQRQFCRALRERLEATPGVTGVSYADQVPLSFGLTPWHKLEIEGYTPAPGESMYVHRTFVPPGYFDLLRIPRTEGRDFTELDEAGKPAVMIVNETFVRRYFAGRNPLGRAVRVEGETRTVVGVVKDIKYHSPTEAPIPYLYIPFRQRFAPGLNFVVFLKTAGDPARPLAAMRREALALNADAVFTTMRLTEATAASLYPQRVAASLLGVLGTVSLLLAAVGLYSVMSYTVSQRTREVGIRMALGAKPADVLRLVVRQGLTMTLPGLLAGILGALASARLVAGMLVRVAPADPLTFLAASGFLAFVAALASCLPALRATRVQPMSALRCE